MMQVEVTSQTERLRVRFLEANSLPLANYLYLKTHILMVSSSRSEEQLIETKLHLKTVTHYHTNKLHVGVCTSI